MNSGSLLPTSRISVGVEHSQDLDEIAYYVRSPIM